MIMLAPGSLVQDRYRIGQLIGQGGFGAVYEAVDERLSRRVALKQSLRTSERLARQFEREAQLLANLHHASLPRVTDHFTTLDGQFLVMDFVPGDDLSTLLLQRDAPFPPAQVLAWGEQLLDVLQYLHSLQPPIIHRDIKPQNLKLKADGSIMLLDFGLAKGTAGQAPPSTGERSLMAYTKGYAPPEQVEGLGTDERSDLYALGATLYCLLTNTAPVEAQTRMLAEARGRPDVLQPAHVLNRAVPEPVSRVLMQALELDPTRRPPNAKAMRALLQAAREGRGGPWPAVAPSQPTVLDGQTVAPAPWWNAPASQPQSQPRSAAPPQAPAAPPRAQTVPGTPPGAYAPATAGGYSTPALGETVPAAPAPQQGMSRCVLSCLLVSLVGLVALGIGGWFAVQWGIDFAQRTVVDPAQQTLTELDPAINGLANLGATAQAAQELANAVPSALAGQELSNTVPTALAELANMVPTAQALASSAAEAQNQTQSDIGPCEVVAQGLNLRSGPGADYTPIAQLVRGTPLWPLERNGDGSWVRVRFEAVSIEGWVGAGEQFISCAGAVWSLPVGTTP